MSVLLQARAGGVLTLTLNRPEKLNAFDGALRDALLAAIEAAAADDAVRVVILTGSGRGFSTGADLDDLFEPDADASVLVREQLRDRYNPIVLGLRRMEKPVIAAINGVAAGIGLSMALACDLRIASAEAQFTMGFSRIGLVPDGGATLLLPLLAGLARGLAFAWTSDVIGADEALRIGLLNDVVPADALARETHALANRLMAISPSALALTKRAFNAAVCPELEAVLEREAVLQEEAARAPGVIEAVNAFRGRRDARRGG
jgi:2-(1,2-epoxy-1,2-dihydrophenyl)acetyl-CoA isomerase